MKEVREDDCLGWAAQLAYYLLFAVFPFFLFLTALLGFLPIPNLMERLMAGLAMVLPGEAVTLLQDNIRQLVTEQKGGLLSFGILAALWSSSSAVVAITAALNQAYDVEEGRPWWKVRGIALLLTMGLSLFLLLAVVLLIFGPQLGGGLASLVGLGSAFEITWNILRWPVSAGLLMVALALVYYFAPDVEQKWQWITPGAVFAVLATLLASLGFSLYVSHFGSYNKTYGSLGAVIVFLTWLYLTGLCVLVGERSTPRSSMPRPVAKHQGTRPAPRRCSPRPGPSRLVRERRGKYGVRPPADAEKRTCGMGAAETAGTPCSAPEHLRGNHPQGPHDNRIAHSLDEPGL